MRYTHSIAVRVAFIVAPWATITGEPAGQAKSPYLPNWTSPNASYGRHDFRFTQKDNTLYAICLGIPRGEVRIRSLGTRGRLFEGDIESIQLLGSNRAIHFRHNPLDLTLRMPTPFEGKHACVFKIIRRQ